MVELIQVVREGRHIGVDRDEIDPASDIMTLATILVLDPDSKVPRFYRYDEDFFPKSNGTASTLQRYGETVFDAAMRCAQECGLEGRPALLNSQFLDTQGEGHSFKGFMTAYYLKPSLPQEGRTSFSGRIINLMPDMFSPTMRAAYRWYKMHGF